MAGSAPRRIEIVPWGYWKANTYTSPVRGQNSGALGGGFIGCVNTTPINSYIAWDVLLDSGTWALDVIYPKYTDQGIITPSLGGTNLSSFDSNAALSYNNVYQATGITVATPGVYELRFTSTGTSGWAYVCTLQLITLRRTGP